MLVFLDLRLLEAGVLLFGGILELLVVLELRRLGVVLEVLLFC